MLDPRPLTPVEGTGARPGADGARRFDFLGACPELADQVERFNERLARNGPASTSQADRVERRLASLERGADRRLRLNRLYVSLQAQAPDGAFDADTFVMSSRDETPERWRFPDDRHLPGAGILVSRLRTAGRKFCVLGYAPMRRLTVRGHWNPGDEHCVVAKAVERRRASGIFGRLRAVQAAFGAASFRVPRVLDSDAACDVITLECLPGASLVESVTAADIPSAFDRLGRVHREIHDRLAPLREGWSAQGYFAGVRERIGWLALLRPERRAFFEAVGRSLAARFPGAGISAFCHGDFRPSQVLVDGDGWSVLNFDDCCIADPHFEAGRLLALARHDMPLIAGRSLSDPAAGRAILEQAEAAYLAGYRAAGGRLNPARLRWYRTCGEVLYLAQSVRRDRIDEQAFEEACCRIETLCLEAIQ